MYNPLKYVDPSGHIPIIDDFELRVLLSGYYQDREPPVPDDIPEIDPDNPDPNNEIPNAPHPNDPNYDDEGWEWNHWGENLGWGWKHRDDPTNTVWRPDKGRSNGVEGEIPHWHGRRPNLPDILIPPADVYRRGRGGQLPLPPTDVFDPNATPPRYPKPGEIPLFQPVDSVPIIPIIIPTAALAIVILSKGGGGGIPIGIGLRHCFQ
jgi:hypothetical protein